jgi:hypothetical protein
MSDSSTLILGDYYRSKQLNAKNDLWAALCKKAVEHIKRAIDDDRYYTTWEGELTQDECDKLQKWLGDYHKLNTVVVRNGWENVKKFGLTYPDRVTIITWS